MLGNCLSQQAISMFCYGGDWEAPKSLPLRRHPSIKFHFNEPLRMVFGVTTPL